MERAAANFHIPPERCYTDYRHCLEQTRPDVVLLCPATAQHGDWVEKVAPYGVHILVEKPFAASLADADRMIHAVAQTGKTFVINWPLAWYPPHITTKRLLAEGVIGGLLEVHYYDGNRGPLRHIDDKIEISADEAARQKSQSWWYQKASGGGSLLDYLGYGVTLGTWFHEGRAPLEVSCMVDAKPGLEVDEHSVTIARYASGLSKYETRWGTFTDPWTLQPQPKCGFVVVGTAGTISSYDYEPVIRLQTRDRPETHENSRRHHRRPLPEPHPISAPLPDNGGDCDRPALPCPEPCRAADRGHRRPERAGQTHPSFIGQMSVGQ